MAFATPRRWPSAHAQRISAHMVFANPPVRRLARCILVPPKIQKIFKILHHIKFYGTYTEY